MSEQIQQLFNQAQAYQQQLQTIMMQKETINAQLVEINNALEEISKMKDDELYKLSGPILIKSTKAEMNKELTEKKELMDMRLKTIEKGELKAKEKLEELKGKLTKVDSGGAG